MNDFKQWLLDYHTHNEIVNMARHRFGGVSRMIYFEETSDLYAKFADSIHDAVREYKDATGEFPLCIVQDFDNFKSFCNTMVWFAAEWFAHEITQGEYIEELNY